MTTTLTEQARRQSALGLAWQTALEITTPNGPPNDVTPDPLADTVGFAVSDYIWGVVSVRTEPGQTCSFRLHLRWAGLETPDDAWDEVPGSDTSIAAGRSATQRVHVAGALRVYVEILTLSGGTVKVLYANATGQVAAP